MSSFAPSGARNELLDLEDLSDDELRKLQAISTAAQKGRARRQSARCSRATSRACRYTRQITLTSLRPSAKKSCRLGTIEKLRSSSNLACARNSGGVRAR